MQRPIVEAHNISYRYGERIAVDGVSFAVQPGAKHAFLGPNGSGKSTLFKVLATIFPLQAGSVDIDGHDLGREVDVIRAKLGVVFQAPAVDKKLTVLQNLRYQAALYGLGGREAATRIDSALSDVGLTDRTKDSVGELSGGLRRRVELAKCLLHQPKILLLDEPSTGLDPGARQDLSRLLRSIEGLTVLLTTHLMDEADEADHVTILSEGRIVADAPPIEVRRGVGGEVFEVTTSEPTIVAELLREKFQLEPTVLDGAVRARKPDAHRIVGELVDALRSKLGTAAAPRITLGAASLEDVYIEKTGHRFWTETPEPEPSTGRRKRR